MRILKDDSAGLIIDIQERLFPHIFENEMVERNSRILIEGLKILNIPVLVTEQYRKGLGLTIPGIRVSVKGFNTFEKMTFSCCDDELFSKELKKSGRKNIIVAGIEAHVCVLQTVIDLLDKGFQPVVVEDCISSRKQKDKEIAVERMRREGAVLTSYESLLFELIRVSGTETFKTISKLVK